MGGLSERVKMGSEKGALPGLNEGAYNGGAAGRWR
jgi:hypothetical protein